MSPGTLQEKGFFPHAFKGAASACGGLKRLMEGRKTAGPESAVQALKGEKVLVVGLGQTGLSVARFLTRCGSRVVATDSKREREIPGAETLARMGVELKTGGHREEDFLSAGLIVVSPGVPGGHPYLEAAREKGVLVVSDIELAWRMLDCPVVAVGGTNGKSTTTALLGTVFEKEGRKVFVGGNIGTPVIEHIEGVFDSGEKADVCVLEISSFQLETTATFNPHIGILLNITEDHLDRYSGFGEYARTKFRLFENQNPSDYAVVNMGDPVIAAHAPLLGGGRIVPFTVSGALEEGLFLRNGDIVFRFFKEEEVYPLGSIRIKGLQNVENAMAVIAASRLSGVPKATVLSALGEFEGLHHRMELVREFGGVRYVDDSKGTNIGALAMALKGTEPPIILIAGGRDKGGDYGVLNPLVSEKVKLVLALGEAREKIRDAFCGSTEVLVVNSMEEAVSGARTMAASGDTVLLSPACSSFDMFRSYKERGERFRALVEALA